ncbi:hypothetical protein PGB90_004970 [Kerria lacca]
MKRREIYVEDFNELNKNLSETDVYITEYMYPSVKFSAIVKHRYSDFQVFEIDSDGNVAHLTSLEEVNNSEASSEIENTDIFEEINVDDVPVKELSYPLNHNEQWKQLTLLMKRNIKTESIKIEVTIVKCLKCVTNIDKNDRTNLHESIKKRYGNKLFTQTMEDENKKKYIIIGTNKNVDKRNNWTWPLNLPQYLHFILYKENTDTINAVRTLCKSLRISQNWITYAGTKDRRAVTTQWICVKRINAKRISALSRNRLWFGNFKYTNKPLNLGDLKGNRFVIVLRKVESSDENLKHALKLFKEKGFINYYGLQRFGSYSIAPTYEIGRHLLCSEWKQAIDLILKPRPDEKQLDLQQACKVWSSTKNATEALKFLNNDNTTEGIVLRTLSEQGNTAYVNALQKIPRNIMLLYIHSFQSIVWNRIISRRIKEFGLTVLPGDLIYDIDPNDTRNITISEDNEEVNVKTVRCVSADDVKNVSIYEVVLPLPGYSIKYPENIIAKWYTEILAEYGITSFNNKNKKFTVSGDYRKILVVPENVEWEIARYNNPNADLVSTDLQKLKNKVAIENVETGVHKAVILKISLPSCTYATMAIRELTKTDTSRSYQTSLTSDHSQNKMLKLTKEVLYLSVA